MKRLRRKQLCRITGVSEETLRYYVEHGEVLDTDGEIIKNLYAAGDMMLGGNYIWDTLSAVLRAAECHLGLPTGSPCCDSTVSTCPEEAIIACTLIAIVATASGAAVNWLTGTTPLTDALSLD